MKSVGKGRRLPTKQFSLLLTYLEVKITEYNIVPFYLSEIFLVIEKNVTFILFLR